MGEKRYFYSCPIKAAYMTKYFGMQYITQAEGLSAKWNDHVTGHGESGWIFEIRFGWDEKLDRFYIHPDSYHLLDKITRQNSESFLVPEEEHDS